MLKKLSLFLVLAMALSLSPNNLLSSLIQSDILAPVEVSAQMSMNQMTDRVIVESFSTSHASFAVDDDGNLWSWGDTPYIGRNGSTSALRSTAGLVTATGMQRIRHVNGSDSVTVALDVDGQVWTWGDVNEGSLGRPSSSSQPADRPGKVTFPAGTGKMISASASYRGGRSVDDDGHIWVWGSSDDSDAYGKGNGVDTTGSSSNTPSPVMLTDSATGNGANAKVANGLANVFFVDVESSNYHYGTSGGLLDGNGGMALDRDGNVWTWGFDDKSAYGGSRWPKKVNFDFQGNVTRIQVGCVFYMALTDTGKVWTWGHNLDSYNQLGHPGTTAVPVQTTIQGDVFAVDASIYYHVICILGADGYMYVAGDERNNQHASSNTLGYTRTAISGMNNAYKIAPHPNAKSKPFHVSEGSRNLSWIDEYGNLYSIAGSTAGLAGGATTAQPWVKFQDDGAPHISSISTNPHSSQHNYSEINATINIGVKTAATSVKYVILREDDADATTYFDKTFYSIESPYLLLDKYDHPWTDSKGRLLVSQFGRYNPHYANPGITEELFNAAYYSRLASGKSGEMDMVGGSNLSWTKANAITSNCVVWFQTANNVGTHRMVTLHENNYSQTRAWISGTAQNSAGQTINLFTNEHIPGTYGYVKNPDNTWYVGIPQLGYDLIKPTFNTVRNYLTAPNNEIYWIIKNPDVQFAEETELDTSIGRATTGYAGDDAAVTLHRRVDRSKEILIDSADKVGDINTFTPSVTLEFEKDVSKWADVNIHYINMANFQDVSVFKNGTSNADGTITSETILNFAAVGAPATYTLGREPYTTKLTADKSKAPIGYIVSPSRPTSTAGLVSSQFPTDFAPTTGGGTAKTDIWVVYGLEYDITYHLNGGTNPADAPVKYTHGEGVTLPTPTKDGYVFGGWYESPNFGENGVTAISPSEQGDKTFYAKWLSYPRVYIDTVGGSNGRDIIVPVRLSENRVSTGSFEIKYDSSLLVYRSVTKGGALDGVADNDFIYSQYNQNGVAGINIMWDGPNDSVDDVIFYITFRVVSNRMTETKLVIDSLSLLDGASHPITGATKTDGTVYVNMLYAITSFEQGGNKVTSGLQSGYIDIYSDIFNKTGSVQRADLIVAMYDTGGKLISVTFTPCENIPSDVINPAPVMEKDQFNIPISDSVAKVKVFYWNGTTAIKPYIAATEITR